MCGEGEEHNSPLSDALVHYTVEPRLLDVERAFCNSLKLQMEHTYIGILIRGFHSPDFRLDLHYTNHCHKHHMLCSLCRTTSSSFRRRRQGTPSQETRNFNSMDLRKSIVEKEKRRYIFTLFSSRDLPEC